MTFWSQRGAQLGTPNYLGLVATRALGVSQIDDSNLYANSRSSHFARGTAFSASQIILQGWMLNSGETSATQNITYQASIEQPIGTILAQYTFGGSTTGIAIAGTNLISDTTPHATIAAGSQFWIRVYEVAPGRILFGMQQAANASIGDGLVPSVVFQGSQTNNPSATYTVAAGRAPIFPLAIIGITNQPSIGIGGDDRTAGFNDTATAFGDIGEVAPSVGPYFNYCSLASLGENAWSLVNYFGTTPGQFANRAVLQQYLTHVIWGHGYNDIKNGQPASRLIAGIYPPLYQLMPNLKQYALTLVSCTNSSDNWATLGNQTPGNSSDNGFTPLGASDLNTVNTWLLGKPAPLVGVFDLASTMMPVPGDGLWPVNGSANWATTDGVHENAVISQQYVANSAIPATAFYP